MKKATLATIKAFMRKNTSRLYIKELSRFDGMVDCVMPMEDSGFRNVSNTFKAPSSLDRGSFRQATCGVPGVWFVDGSRNWFEPYSDANGFNGFRVSNCCGSFVIATKG